MPSAPKNGVIRHCWALYRLALQKHTVATQVVSTAVLWGAGDTLSQMIEGQKKIDWTRTAVSASFAGIFVGPLGHYWYLGLDNYARRSMLPGSRQYLAFKVLADCLLFSPVEIAGFFSFMEATQGKGVEGIPDKLRSDLWPTLGAQLTYWPLFQWFNFSMVPVKFQLLSVNIAGIFDSAFVCWANSREGWAQELLAKVLPQAQTDAPQERARRAICPADDHSSASAVAAVPLAEPRRAADTSSDLRQP